MNKQIGQVFTPIKWAEWLIRKWSIYDAWIKGAHLCDPTAGQGAFIIALLKMARSHGIRLTPERLSRLSLIEIDPFLIDQFKKTVNCNFGIEFPNDQLFCQDIIIEEHNEKYDILIGNPPWVNFNDLPLAYKKLIKPFFIHEGLVLNKKRTLLGSSRIDIAALVIKVVIGKLLKKKGKGYFYLPTSLFFGDGAHNGFRNYKANSRNFSIETVYEFNSSQVFEGVNTSYCCAKFEVDSQQLFPIPYFKENSKDWSEHKAAPLEKPDDPWRIVKDLADLISNERLNICLSPEQKPRQGVNTCGANSVYIFDQKPSNLPDEFLYPLVTKEIWRQTTYTPHKWILLPYHQETGKPIDWNSIMKHDALRNYLQYYQDVLQARKGALLKASMNRGRWWALLGVGTYSFAPFKVIWEAYGQDQFNPIVMSNIDGNMWQANQAMHAFIPCWTQEDAQQIKIALEKPTILKLLRQLNGTGKCNWAQPGKIKKILNFGEIQNRLF